MDHQEQYQNEYHEELQKVQDRDFTHNWVSSSAFMFYLSVFCIVAFLLGTCFVLFQERYKGTPDVVIPDNTKYTPQYK